MKGCISLYIFLFSKHLKTNLPTDDSNCSSGKVNMNLNLHTLSNTVNSGNLSEMFEKRNCLSVSCNKHSVTKWYSVSTTEQ